MNSRFWELEALLAVPSRGAREHRVASASLFRTLFYYHCAVQLVPEFSRIGAKAHVYEREGAFCLFVEGAEVFCIKHAGQDRIELQFLGVNGLSHEEHVLVGDMSYASIERIAYVAKVTADGVQFLLERHFYLRTAVSDR